MDKHDTILLACGTADHRRQLRSVLQERYNLLEADNTQQMLLLLGQNVDCIAALVLTLTVPEKVDVALLERDDKSAILKRVPTILVADRDTPALVNRGFEAGAADVIPMGYEPMPCSAGLRPLWICICTSSIWKPW